LNILSVAQASLRIATPLVLASAGETVTERAGVIDVGIEGLMLAGACASFLVALATGSAILALLAAIVAGVALSLVFAALVLLVRADQVVTGLGLNLLSFGICGTAYGLAVGARGTEARLHELPTFLGQEPFAWGALLLALAVRWFLLRSTWGVAIRAAGDAPLAAEAAGISVRRVRVLAILAGGTLAAIAGADLALAHAQTFSEDMTGGRGFMALSLVLFGRWSPSRVVLAAIFFGAAEAMEHAVQAEGARWLASKKELVLALPYILTLVALALRRRGRDDAPGALGVPLERRS